MISLKLIAFKQRLYLRWYEWKNEPQRSIFGCRCCSYTNDAHSAGCVRGGVVARSS
jgi:hypothetical protein